MRLIECKDRELDLIIDALLVKAALLDQITPRHGYRGHAVRLDDLEERVSALEGQEVLAIVNRLKMIRR